MIKRRGRGSEALQCSCGESKVINDKNVATYSLNINDAKCTELIRFFLGGGQPNSSDLIPRAIIIGKATI